MLTWSNYYNLCTFTDIHLQFVVYPHIHHTDSPPSKNSFMHEVQSSSKVQTTNSQKADPGIQHVFLGKARARVKGTRRNLLLMDLKQELPFHTTTEWSWAIKEEHRGFDSCCSSGFFWGWWLCSQLGTLSKLWSNPKKDLQWWRSACESEVWGWKGQVYFFLFL